MPKQNYFELNKVQQKYNYFLTHLKQKRLIWLLVQNRTLIVEQYADIPQSLGGKGNGNGGNGNKNATAGRAASGYIFNDSSLGLAVGGGRVGGNASTTDWSYVSNSGAGEQRECIRRNRRTFFFILQIKIYVLKSIYLYFPVTVTLQSEPALLLLAIFILQIVLPEYNEFPITRMYNFLA